ncbi:MAG: GUN4 domain-containing protein [Nostoc sp.]|uniref:GUN4 domain-containing protein n=1 Tax=Nostoc sp. TaxID=1180 RepID=UPI002FFB0A6D
MAYKHDVFISHASEDKDSFVTPLAKKLKDIGYEVWYDEFSLRLGDSLRRSIDYGLANSKYGIVVISPNFLRKEWPQRELDGLMAREINGSKVILPIWYEVNFDDVLRYSPTLADRLAVKTSHGMDYVVSKIVEVLQQQFSDTTAPKYEDITQHLYTQLEYFLKVKNWLEADNQTYRLILNIAKKEKYLDYDSINSFSCPDLRKIDQLWVANSDKRFGFSVQKEIWIKTGNSLGIQPQNWTDKDSKNYLQFAKAVGWYKGDTDNEMRNCWASRDQVLKRIEENGGDMGSLPWHNFFSERWLRRILSSRVEACQL